MQATRRLLTDDAGVLTVSNVIWTIAILAIGGLAVDVNNAHRMRTMMQAASDAAVLAAIQEMPVETDVKAMGVDYAEANLPQEDHGIVVVADDVEIGIWDSLTATFTPIDEPTTTEVEVLTTTEDSPGSGFGGGGTSETPPVPNAVRAILRRTLDSGNPLPAFFTRIFGFQSWNIEVQAVAVQDFFNCLDGGFVSRGKVYSGSENVYVDRLCIHGQKGVKVGSTNYFEDGVEVTMQNLGDLEASQDNDGLNDALGTRDYDPPLVDMIPQLIDDFEVMQNLPSFIHHGPVHVEYMPEKPAPNTLYVVEEVVDFGSGSSGAPLVLSNFAVISNKEIKSGSNVLLENVLIASMDKVSFGSEMVIGNVDYCNTGDGRAYIFSQGEYSAGSQSSYNGVQIVGGGIVKLGSELYSMKGVAVQAGGDIFWGSAEQFGGCGAPTEFLTPSGGRLVL